MVCNPKCENGVCIANDTCSCSAGFTGQACTEKGNGLRVFHVFLKQYLYVLHIVYSECHSNPCLNGGTCVNHAQTYTCLCAPDFNGTTCENGEGQLLFYHKFNLGRDGDVAR